VDLVYTYNSQPEGIEQGSTKAGGTYPNDSNVGGRFLVLFDVQAAGAVGPVMQKAASSRNELWAPSTARMPWRLGSWAWATVLAWTR